MIALFGAKGYLGRQLAYYFTQKGEAVQEFDIPECDVTDASLWSAFDPSRYSSIVFFAGLTGTEKGFNEAAKYTSVNELGLLNLLVKLAPLGAQAPKVIFPSSRLVYRGSDYPLKEDAPKEAKTVYAANKLACEMYLEAYHNRFGIPYSVLRICVPYGNIISADYSYGTIGFFMKQIAAGKPITLFGGGTQGRTFTHVEDICRAVETLIVKGECGVYNMGGDAYSLHDAAVLVAGDEGKVVAVPWPKEAELIESGSTVFDSSKLDELTGGIKRHLKDSTQSTSTTRLNDDCRGERIEHVDEISTRSTCSTRLTNIEGKDA